MADTVPLNPHVVPLHQRTNTWKFQFKNKDGKLVEAAPGKPFMILKGPTSKADLIAGATLMLNNFRLDAIRAGLEDPGYEILPDTVEPQPEDQSEFGAFRPAGATPIELPTSAAVKAHHERLIAEGTGQA